MKINGIPRPDKHRKLPAKKLPKQDESGGLCGLIALLTCSAVWGFLAGVLLASDGVTL